MAETDSLRPVIADILDGLGGALIQQRRPGFLGLVRGAETLRWTHEFEDGTEAQIDRIADLEEQLESAEDERLGAEERCAALDSAHNTLVERARRMLAARDNLDALRDAVTTLEAALPK